MTEYKPIKIVNFKISQEHILKIKQGNNLVDKQSLLSCYKAHNRYITDLEELSNSYTNAIKKTYFGLIFLVLLQMVLLFRISKHNKSLEKNI